MEDHSPHRHLGPQLLEEVPGDRFAFAVLVRREQQLVGFLQLALEVGDNAFLVRVDDVVRLEALVDRDAQRPVLLSLLLRDLRGALRQVTDVLRRRYALLQAFLTHDPKLKESVARLQTRGPSPTRRGHRSSYPRFCTQN